MIIFDNFCCCVPLKVFGTLIGWVGATTSIALAYVVLLIVLLMDPDKILKYKNRFFGLEGVSEADLPTYLIIVACVLLATAAFHVILIFGIKFRKSFAIVPYILLLIGLISFVNCVVYGSYESTWQENSADDKIKLITVYVFAVLLSIYLILCMYSLYKTIKFEENRRKNYILPN